MRKHPELRRVRPGDDRGGIRRAGYRRGLHPNRDAQLPCGRDLSRLLEEIIALYDDATAAEGELIYVPKRA
jgi:hypothetical protein